MAVDNIDELLHNALSPVARAYPRRGLLADAAPLHLHATDVTGGEWTLYGDGERWLRWETGHAKGEAAVRGPRSSCCSGSTSACRKAIPVPRCSATRPSRRCGARA
ncbi:hypothetical protein ACFQZC_27580 [Streptacidiphilus monticola]